MRTVTLPNNKTIRLSTYVEGWKKLISICRVNPAIEIHGWEWYPVRADVMRRKLIAGIHDRINQGVPAIQRGTLQRIDQTHPTRNTDGRFKAGQLCRVDSHLGGTFTVKLIEYNAAVFQWKAKIYMPGSEWHGYELTPDRRDLIKIAG